MLKLLYQTMRALTNPHIPDALIRCIYELKILTINGQGPQVFQCVNCGNKAETAVFSAGRGGLVCETCAGEVRDGIRLASSTLYSMQYIESSKVEHLYTFKMCIRDSNGLLPVTFSAKGKYRQAFRIYDRNKDTSSIVHIIGKAQEEAISRITQLDISLKKSLDINKGEQFEW